MNQRRINSSLLPLDERPLERKKGRSAEVHPNSFVILRHDGESLEAKNFLQLLFSSVSPKASTCIQQHPKLSQATRYTSTLLTLSFSFSWFFISLLSCPLLNWEGGRDEEDTIN